jgi:hypothetical protein
MCNLQLGGYGLASVPAPGEVFIRPADRALAGNAMSRAGLRVKARGLLRPGDKGEIRCEADFPAP